MAQLIRLIYVYETVLFRKQNLFQVMILKRNLRVQYGLIAFKPNKFIQVLTYQILLHKKTPHQNLTQQVNRIRKKDSDGAVANPKCKKDIIIPNKLSQTFSGSQFVFFDSGPEDKDRMIVLATEENINYLNNSNIWCVDGTFEISPTLFKQLFTINVIESGRNIPLLYAFLSDKEQETYSRLFEILSKRLNSSPAYILCDFEKAILNSLQHYFPSSTISGCWFHLASNLYKHLQSNGLVQQYRSRTDSTLRTCYKYLKFLAFVPAHDVIETFEMIKSMSPSNFKPILDYFEKYYIGLPSKKDPSKRVVPWFPIKLWNVNKRIVKDLPRTNNHIEAWHKSLCQDIESHPTFIKLLKHLLREQRLAEKFIDEVRMGINVRRSNKEIKKDIAVKNLLEEYDPDKKVLFLDKLIAIYATKKVKSKDNLEIQYSSDSD